ncbi:MAG: glycosyltransferase family 39 protein, partial [Patescibacteria group bacterium]|nr:glycosyltransferase family 39 protein [Patescibacteria group bacterium]
MSSRSVLLIIIFLAAFFLRIWNLSSPVFTSDETRIAYRGYTLSHFGKDELGRKWPIIFNSLNDYQLPLTSYLTSAGVLVFGKNDLGARLPFILIGSIIPILVYLIASKLSSRKLFPEVSSLILTLSPLMIFLSKTPNEIIINTFFILLIFYLFLKDQSLKRFVITVIVIIVAMLTSKEMWIVLPLFTFLSLRPEKKVSKSAVILTGLVLIFSVIMIISFLTIEQSKRSLIENNLNLFTDITINNGINRLRGQGIESGWPGLIDKFLFSKLHFLTTGFLHWISAMQPAILFGQLHDFIDDLPPMLNFFPRVMLVALIMGIILMVKKDR